MGSCEMLYCKVSNVSVCINNLAWNGWRFMVAGVRSYRYELRPWLSSVWPLPLVSAHFLLCQLHKLPYVPSYLRRCGLELIDRPKRLCGSVAGPVWKLASARQGKIMGCCLDSPDETFSRSLVQLSLAEHPLLDHLLKPSCFSVQKDSAMWVFGYSIATNEHLTLHSCFQLLLSDMIWEVSDTIDFRVIDPNDLVLIPKSDCATPSKACYDSVCVESQPLPQFTKRLLNGSHLNPIMVDTKTVGQFLLFKGSYQACILLFHF